MKAIWNGKVIAESDRIINVEGNHYFPNKSVNKKKLSKSSTHAVWLLERNCVLFTI